MRRTILLGAILLAVLALLAAPAVGLASPTDIVTQDESDEDANEAAADDQNVTAPGEQLAGVVGVQEAELEGDIDQRAFGIQVAEAASNDSRADVVVDRLGAVDERIDELEERKEELEEKREAGEISEGKYKAEMAKVAAETQGLSQTVDQTDTAAGQLPVEHLEERGINATAIQTLQEQASELSGPEVAEIARSIAGPGAGQGPPADVPGNATGPPENATGPPGDDHPGNATDPGNDTDGADDAPGNGTGPPADDDPGEGPPGDDDQPGEGPPGDDDQPGEGPPGDDDDQGEGPPGDDDQPGEGPPDDDDDQGEGPPGDDDQPGEGPPGDDGDDDDGDGEDDNDS